ncbi:hypothetical protein CFOL_v3_21021 [Cephalotus follicularis]|uniref:F-box associated domain-containing protein n=1 Tax=Cephalotus follicularis TaxID=3775 RepID=A0A1Q3CBD3_CEPFO|nr:hypothetical protein CFOL_v3_21021 [Cephalotus follicularis]
MDSFVGGQLILKRVRLRQSLPFHFSDEVFQMIPLPDSSSMLDESTRTLSVLGESLVLLDYPGFGVKDFVHVWAMDEFGIDGTWSKILTIRPLERIESPLVFWKKDELLMRDSTGSWLQTTLAPNKSTIFFP